VSDSSDPARRGLDAWRGLRALVMESHDHRKEACDALDLSFIRVKALRRLARAPMPMRDLAALLLTDAPYLTVIVDDLEARGLVERKVNPEDRRSKLVAVTAAGRRAAQRADEILDRPPPQLDSLSESELATLTRIITKLGEPGRA
jgi:DNA-binding MarR family transcriptional regulator